VNVWIAAASGLSISLIPCAVVAFRGGVVDRLVAFEMASVCLSLVLLLLAEGYARTIFFDLAVALSLLSFGGGLVFARFLERWL
jgi:multicomponent Na+:H+ antiporter subunit F